MVGPQLNIKVTFTGHQALQFKNTFSRHNNLLNLKVAALEFRLAQSKAVSICCDSSQVLA